MSSLRKILSEVRTVLLERYHPPGLHYVDDKLAQMLSIRTIRQHIDAGTIDLSEGTVEEWEVELEWLISMYPNHEEETRLHDLRERFGEVEHPRMWIPAIVGKLDDKDSDVRADMLAQLTWVLSRCAADATDPQQCT